MRTLQHRLILKRSLLISLPCSFLYGIMFILIFAITPALADSLETMLPTDSSIKGIKATDAPQLAEGEALYKIINGGAVLFFQHNFKSALFQEYAIQDGKTISLEIYRMASPTDASDVYKKRKWEEGSKLSIGQEGVLGDYYCMFRQGPFYVTVTGEDATEGVRNAMVLIATAVSKNLK